MKKTDPVIRKQVFLLAGLAVLNTAHAQNPNVVTLRPGPEGKDTYVCDCKPNVNNPNGSITHLYQGQYGVCWDRILIRWDLSSLPKGISITSAVMELKCNMLFGSPNGRMVYYRFSGDWGETDVTCATLPIHAIEDSVVTGWPSMNRWHSVDITKMVQKWVADPAANFGLYGHSAQTTSQCCAEFNSSDASPDTVRPKLTITYLDPRDAEERGASRPIRFSLGQNHPNPFNPATVIEYSIPRTEAVSLKIYNLLGDEVQTLVNGIQEPGAYRVRLNGSRLVAGIYLYRIRAGNFSDVKKLIFAK
jgi:hypothetical protein